MIYGDEYVGTVSVPIRPDSTICGSCRQPAETLSQCVWDPDLMVGPCCEVYTAVPGLAVLTT
jgi:hypothetical protein